ncbi:hypothetical protein [Mycobacteroides abscessus]|uniref:hypothetical protein n=1 Tax=Mycobacteroides abscessus TaxID=36809 RepID=UPI00105415D5|nr:hypothetical protein [Mycobacteroides abscessus]MBN7323290.1 hypothetical protein [Mycobacteroides abscessus subsp. massiliense]MDM2495045.1 hypothetical protein [Mycobacteroides abscessus]MDM2513999.1 hypothetical protein [Mycobacteroides abscessus]MDM2524306.1 hypothetical protein [Mycobacteroides abscessus]MDM2528709.1 hypothetical protein [Mycobacteroides abscessus]
MTDYAANRERPRTARDILVNWEWLLTRVVDSELSPGVTVKDLGSYLRSGGVYDPYDRLTYKERDRDSIRISLEDAATGAIDLQPDWEIMMLRFVLQVAIKGVDNNENEPSQLIGLSALTTLEKVIRTVRVLAMQQLNDNPSITTTDLAKAAGQPRGYFQQWLRRQLEMITK